jgi:hypothetical protein
LVDQCKAVTHFENIFSACRGGDAKRGLRSQAQRRAFITVQKDIRARTRIHISYMNYSDVTTHMSVNDTWKIMNVPRIPQSYEHLQLEISLFKCRSNTQICTVSVPLT